MKLSAPLWLISKWPPSVPATVHSTLSFSGSGATKDPTAVPLFSTMLKAPAPFCLATTGASFTFVTRTARSYVSLSSPSEARMVTL